MKTKISLLALLLIWGSQSIFSWNTNNDWKETPNRITLNGFILIHSNDPGYGTSLDYVRFLNRFLGIKGGIGLQFWSFNDYKPQWEVTDRNGKHYNLDHDESTLDNFNIQVGPVFRLPLLTVGKDKNMTISWECHPSVAKHYNLDHDESTLDNFNIQVGPVFRLPLLTVGKDKNMTISWECHPSVAFTLPNITFSYLHKEMVNGRWVQQEKRVRNHGGQWNFWQLKNAVCLQNDVVVFSLGYSFSNQQPYSAVKDVRFDGKKISASTPSVKLTHEVQASLGFCF